MTQVVLHNHNYTALNAYEFKQLVDLAKQVGKAEYFLDIVERNTDTLDKNVDLFDARQRLEDANHALKTFQLAVENEEP